MEIIFIFKARTKFEHLYLKQYYINFLELCQDLTELAFPQYNKTYLGLTALMVITLHIIISPSYNNCLSLYVLY
jgi:hypothetical protein